MASSSRARRARLWLVASGALVASGCAAITGLDQYVKGGADASSDAIGDQTVSDVAHPDAPTTDAGNDSNPPGDAGDAGPVQDGGGDAGDAGNDAGDAGCGPVNTITNCSACGAQCDTTNASNTACNGTTCVYQCKSGFSNCDAAAPDLNGCE
ncbi:MAG TPA: hypothetical protein VLM85_18135, partial [Polyangiaceae bacterium]|nr:hypothetical protein [Polyangiaceae bacterium]